MLSQRARDEFARTGLVRVADVLTGADAAEVRADIWRYLKREYAIDELDRTTWTVTRIPTFKGLRRSAAFAKVGEGAVPAALDDLLGVGWAHPKEWAGKPMVTFPMPGTEWDVPTGGWHFDRPYPPDGLPGAPGVNVFVFAGPVRQRGAGTVVMTGSHRLVARYAAASGDTVHARELKAALISDHRWFRDLITADARPDRIRQFMVEGTEIDGVELRVVELTGEPGEAILMDARTLHTIGSNCLDEPRMMLNQLISRQ